MAIGRPRGDQPAPLAAVAQRRMAGRRLSCLARNARQRRGRKSIDRRCGKVIEAQPTLGQISPSEAAWAPPRTDHEETDERRPFWTRGRKHPAENQVRFRVNGGETADETAIGSRLHRHVDAILRPMKRARPDRESRSIASACRNVSPPRWSRSKRWGRHRGSSSRHLAMSEYRRTPHAGHVCASAASLLRVSDQRRPAASAGEPGGSVIAAGKSDRDLRQASLEACSDFTGARAYR
jgi:hypothetical protein